MFWKNNRREVETGLAAVYPRLWRYALTLTANRAQADDLANAACLRALEKASTFQPGTAVDRWVFTIARRIWLNDMRAAAVRRGGGLVDVEQADLVDEKLAPDANLFFREVLSKVMALPEAQRETVILVYVEEFSYKEAAEILGIPIGTVMSRLAAARGRLSKEVNPDMAVRARKQ